MTRAAPEQLTLLDWTPPAPVQRFAEERVRAANLRGQIARAVAAALKDADGNGLYREEVAQRMADFLGERVSVNVLNSYASQAREEANIPVVRFAALVHATRDQRLVEMLAELLGCVVIERRYLPLIEMAALRDRAETLERRAKLLAQQARREGGL